MRPMTVPQFVQQWTEQAAHDLEAARVNRQMGFYDVSIVLCQQSVEKYLKALWAHQQAATPPRSHDLDQIAQAVGAPGGLVTRAGALSSEYLVARYPDVAQATPYKKYTEADADGYLRLAEEIQQWVLAQLPSSTP
jgi:HEPN domain-containing protein